MDEGAVGEPERCESRGWVDQADRYMRNAARLILAASAVVTALCTLIEVLAGIVS